ncbi:3-hexulose-6-phosphate synthase/6-phospho-3-hexuloisomerase [Methanomicrobium sp. W14]|uniref:orotidine 5'-phosphate decarboxylase / HUMPS family protein n=1 Tax=Methanomicrobium sp. W14 TaxID=2817839 RepID=UPI001AEAA902|nr:orotidine 5'-phosphate decarboxylase / HUMPS family protein [Methanomicrobium sp. W14]MBP2133891.1 3-hexulose-6-phosphate synthase/6-phospho-3-hexuloisomerase [Methanomicrobium sp. W14]
MSKPILQVALDLTELKRAVQIAKEAVEGGADWIEAGTPLIKSEGMNAVRTLRAKFPDNKIVADMKIADTGTLEVEMAAKAGADVVCVLATSDDSVIEEAVRAGDLYGVSIMADLLNEKEPAKRAAELEKMGVDIIAAHIGIDQQMRGMKSVDLLKEISGLVSIPVGAAGGLNDKTAAEAVLSGADILLVGSSITKAADVKAAAALVRKAIDSPDIDTGKEKSRDDEIRDILLSVSAPNVTDAMHRKGAMSGLISLCGEVKMVGRALTVNTIAGDWAKPVEAIDVAQKGDVIVINNQRATYISPWGELATNSAFNRGVTGIIIDGAARDVDDIKKVGIPVFATGTCPNAGEPKGFGEIGAEISCCGQQVRNGDWIIGDESGVVVIPKERAYETARRALEVKKSEMRIREEIKRGSTLSSVSELIRWEKK